MREKQLEILKENLERRFGLLIKNLNYNSLFISKLEYLNYLFSEKIAGEVIENLIKKVRLDNTQINMLALGYFDYVVGKVFRQTKLETLGKDNNEVMFNNYRPPFYTPFINSELHLQSKAFFYMNEIFGMDPKLAKEPVDHSNLEPDEIFKKLKGDSKIKKSLKELVEYHKNKPIKLIDAYDVEINNFSFFHSSLIEEINDLLKEYSKPPTSENSITKKNLDNKYWITKNEEGEYLFNESLVDIKNHKAQYVKIFDVTYSLKPEGGQITYSNIIDGCKKRGLTITKKSIQGALTAKGSNANFFRYVKDIKQAPSHGVNLFRAQNDGKHLEFNNKKK